MITTWDRFLVERLNVAHSFSSTQVNLPEEIAKKVISWGKKHIPDKDLYEKDDKYGREDEIHVTVLYGIHDANPLSTIRVLWEERSFKLELGKVSLFNTSPDYDVVKVEVISPKLHMLHKLLKKKLDHTDKWNDYHPHVTVAYVEKNTCNKLVSSDDLRGTKFLANEIIFSSTNGEKTEIYLGMQPSWSRA